jgi:hypothetical protein
VKFRAVLVAAAVVVAVVVVVVVRRRRRRQPDQQVANDTLDHSIRSVSRGTGTCAFTRSSVPPPSVFVVVCVRAWLRVCVCWCPFPTIFDGWLIF